MRKIIIQRKSVDDGRRWWIKNWKDYVDYLKEAGLPSPLHPYGIFVGFETEMDYRHYHGDFETQVPLLFQIDAKRVQYEIVDA